LKHLLGAVSALFGIVAVPGSGGLDLSPDGKSVAISTLGGISILPVDGGQPRPIPESGAGLMPVWSPDSSRILYSRRVNDTNELLSYEVATNRARQIGTNLGWPYAWREDGKRVAAVQKIEDGDYEMVWFDLIEGGIAQSVKVPEPLWMVWLPETDSIAFLASLNGKRNIYTVENAEVKQISKTNDIVGLSLSADKRAILWARRGANLKFQLLTIYRYDLKARSASRIEFPMRIPLINPDSARAPSALEYVTFSPDGSHLAIVVRRSTKQGSGAAACYVARMDGSEARLVRQTSGKGDVETLFPVWSRDGSKLGIYDAQANGLTAAVFDATGRNGKRILTETRP
jgi:Tol biopolymer transport system component